MRHQIVGCVSAMVVLVSSANAQVSAGGPDGSEAPALQGTPEEIREIVLDTRMRNPSGVQKTFGTELEAYWGGVEMATASIDETPELERWSGDAFGAGDARVLWRYQAIEPVRFWESIAAAEGQLLNPYLEDKELAGAVYDRYSTALFQEYQALRAQDDAFTLQFNRTVESIPRATLRRGPARSIGGRPSRPGEHPASVAIGEKLDDDTYSWFCSGTLIAPRVVVTAAHCWFNTRFCFPYPKAPTQVVYVGMDPNAYDPDDPSTGRVYEVDLEISKYSPDYSCQDSSNDIGVLVLKTPVPAQAAPPAEIGDVDQLQLQRGDFVTAVGYGTHDPQNPTMNARHQVDIFIMDVWCLAQNPYGCFEGYEFSAAGVGREDTCYGDSGGGVFYRNAGGQWQLVALTSRAIFYPGIDCGAGGIYVRIAEHMDFIQDVAGELLPPG